MRKEEVESALAKEEDEEMSWIQRLLKTCSYSSTRRQNVGLIAAILPEPSQRPITKTVVLEVCTAYTVFCYFLHLLCLFPVFSFKVFCAVYPFICVTFKFLSNVGQFVLLYLFYLHNQYSAL